MRISIFLGCFFLMGTMLSAQNGNPCNCCTDAYKAFDFWVGEWQVVNSNNGKPAGINTISKEEGGCVIRENWTSASPGYTGTSLNFYNATTKQWEQLWIDNTGAYLKLKGNRKDNQMILSSDPFTKDGQTLVHRITWTANKDGSVRQLWEVLEGDKVTATAFDGLYTKK
nr:hypothetical protein [Allomuricauda sp.]